LADALLSGMVAHPLSLDELEENEREDHAARHEKGDGHRHAAQRGSVIPDERQPFDKAVRRPHLRGLGRVGERAVEGRRTALGHSATTRRNLNSTK